ncbi:MAG TPA: hypothetical protein VEH31_31595, partial [Streptosporangiaceae bacterium]|nr:hypothetical protein [Streptosporangiaceae bacterium]
STSPQIRATGQTSASARPDRRHRPGTTPPSGDSTWPAGHPSAAGRYPSRRSPGRAAGQGPVSPG